MTKKQSRIRKAMPKTQSEAEKAARKLLAEIVQDDDRLKAARDAATNLQGNGSSVIEQSLRTFRQHLKD